MAELRFEFLDVGEGDGTIIEFPNEEVMLVDFGSLKNRKLTTTDAIAYIVKYFPQLKKEQHLEYLVITHGDQDHYNFIQKLFEALNLKTIGNFLYAGKKVDFDNFGKKYLPKLIDMALEVPRLPAQFHSDPKKPYWTEGDVQIWILSANYPSVDAVQTNPKSIVMRFRYKSLNMILCGDATDDTEASILSHYGAASQFLSTDLLKAGHHGSDTSSSVEWIKATKPEIVYISADMHLGYGLPKCYIVKRIIDNTKLFKLKEKHGFVCWNHVKNYWDDNEVETALLCSLITANQGVQWEFRVDSKGDWHIGRTAGLVAALEIPSGDIGKLP
ncbi:MAG: hypothetical protein ABSH09_11495 [Bryobacteraceae bacterium]|jgi:beta-lactamase superfamily II metal-dependent hydrolase